MASRKVILAQLRGGVATDNPRLVPSSGHRYLTVKETERKNARAPRWAPIDDVGSITTFLSRVKYVQGTEVEDFNYDAGLITIFLSRVKYLQGTEVGNFLSREHSNDLVNYPIFLIFHGIECRT